MSSHIDFVVEPGYPQQHTLEKFSQQVDASLTVSHLSQWQHAISAGQSPWIALVDRRLTLSSADINRIETEITHATTPIWLCHSSDTSVNPPLPWLSCPPVIAVHWGNPAADSLICIQRSAINSLPAFAALHTEPIWEWLTRAVLLPETVTSANAPDLQRPQELSLAGRQRLPPLAPTGTHSHRPWLIDHITQLKPSQLVPEKLSEADSVAVKAGLLLWHDALDASHQLSQSVEGLGARQAGDYWHAIMHRREPDYGNAKYWFRQLGPHSIFKDLADAAKVILSTTPDGATWSNRLLAKSPWDPFAFVNLCETCAGREETPLGLAARLIQAVEMELLMAATYLDASSKSSLK